MGLLLHVVIYILKYQLHVQKKIKKQMKILFVTHYDTILFYFLLQF